MTFDFIELFLTFAMALGSIWLSVKFESRKVTSAILEYLTIGLVLLLLFMVYSNSIYGGWNE